MGLFTRKPSRGLSKDLIKHANGAMNILGYALTTKKTNSRAQNPDEVLDLTAQENRDAIRSELVRIVREFRLEGCTEVEIDSDRLMPVIRDESVSAITDAAVASVLAINSINLITRLYYEKYPSYQPLFEMVDNLAKMGCTGAAQTIGEDLPPTVAKTWPYFARIFEEAKRSGTPLWPCV